MVKSRILPLQRWRSMTMKSLQREHTLAIKKPELLEINIPTFFTIGAQKFGYVRYKYVTYNKFKRK